MKRVIMIALKLKFPKPMAPLALISPVTHIPLGEALPSFACRKEYTEVFDSICLVFIKDVGA